MKRLVLPLLVLMPSSIWSLDLFEDFARHGRPQTSDQVTWSYRAELYPVANWEEIIPGDGFAYLKVDADPKHKKAGAKWPFQMISFSSVGPNHRLEMRAKNTVIPGVACFIFSYAEDKDEYVDEIDIEVVGVDTSVHPEGHASDAHGWTDARFNTWSKAHPVKLKPSESIKQAIVDEAGKKVSHADDQFHIYTIDWYVDRVEFFIDGVYQASITEVVPSLDSEILLGMRHMSWTGALDWPGTQTMIIDWIRVTELDSSELQASRLTE